jgi:hypothetical protein
MITKSDTIKIKTLQHNVTGRVDKVKAIKRTKNGVRMKPERQMDKSRKHLALTQQILRFSSHLHLATTSYISILIFNYFLSDQFDHPFQTFTFKDFRACEKYRSLRTKAVHWAKTVATQLAIPEPTRLTRNPEN